LKISNKGYWKPKKYIIFIKENPPEIINLFEKLSNANLRYVSGVFHQSIFDYSTLQGLDAINYFINKFIIGIKYKIVDGEPQKADYYDSYLTENELIEFLTKIINKEKTI